MRQYSNKKDLFIELVRTNFKIRYSSSFLGLVWVLIKPFVTFITLYVVWSAFRGGVSDNYQVNLLLGIMLYSYINEGVVFGMNGLLDKADIILKVNFPREIAVVSSIGMASINLSINLVIFYIFTLFNDVTWTLIGIVWFIVVVFIFTLLIYGLNLFLSIILIRLRDLEHIFELGFQTLFWGTPIVYELGEGAGKIGGTLGDIISLNPLTFLVTLARGALIEGKIVNLVIWGKEYSSVMIMGILFVISLILIFFGRLYFRSQIRKIAEYF